MLGRAGLMLSATIGKAFDSTMARVTARHPLRVLLMLIGLGTGLLGLAPAARCDPDLVMAVNADSILGDYGGKGVAGVRDTVTGNIFIEGNLPKTQPYTGRPLSGLHPILQARVDAQKALAGWALSLSLEDQKKLNGMSREQLGDFLESRGWASKTQGMDNGTALKGVLEKIEVRTSRPSGVQGGQMNEKGQWNTYYEAGTHAEVLAVDKALKARDWHNAQNGLPPVTADDLSSFTAHVVHRGTAEEFPMCNHCAHILDGVETTPGMKAATVRERTIGIGGTSSDPSRTVAGSSQDGSGFLDNATRLPDNLPDRLQTRRPRQQQPPGWGAACAANVLRAGGDGTATPESVAEALIKLRRARGDSNPDAQNMSLGELDELLRARNVESNVRPVGSGAPNATGVGKAPTLAQTLAEANAAGRRVLVRIVGSDGPPH